MLQSHVPAYALDNPVQKDGTIRHVVIAWLKTPGNQVARNRFIEVTKSFCSIPGVISVSVGPVLPSGRNVVDSSFDVATVLTFQNRKGLDSYLNHPKHLRAVKEVLDPLVKKVLVYDFVAH